MIRVNPSDPIGDRSLKLLAALTKPDSQNKNMDPNVVAKVVSDYMVKNSKNPEAVAPALELLSNVIKPDNEKAQDELVKSGAAQVASDYIDLVNKSGLTPE